MYALSAVTGKFNHVFIYDLKCLLYIYGVPKNLVTYFMITLKFNNSFTVTIR